MRFTEVSRLSVGDIERFYRAAESIEARVQVESSACAWFLATDSEDVRKVCVPVPVPEPVPMPAHTRNRAYVRLYQGRQPCRLHPPLGTIPPLPTPQAVMAGPYRHKVVYFEGPVRHLDFEVAGCDKASVLKMFVDWWVLREADALVVSGDSTFGVSAHMLGYAEVRTPRACGRRPWQLRAVMNCDVLHATSQTSTVCQPCRSDEEVCVRVCTCMCVWGGDFVCLCECSYMWVLVWVWV